MRTGRAGPWLVLFTVYLAFGSAFLAIKVALRDLPPGLLSGVRFFVAGAVLYVVADRFSSPAQRAEDPIGWRQWAGCSVVGILLLACGNGGVVIAEKHVASGLAAVLIATVPLWMITLGVLINHERVTLRSGLGLIVGLVGVLVLASGSSFGGDIGYIILVLGGAALWGLGSVLGLRVPLPQRILMAAAIQMIAAGVVMLIAGVCFGEIGDLHLSQVSGEAWLAELWLIVPASIIGFSGYGYVLSRLGLSIASTYAYANPVVAVILGTLFLNESLTVRFAIGGALVVVSVILTLRRSSPAVDPDDDTVLFEEGAAPPIIARPRRFARRRAQP